MPARLASSALQTAYYETVRRLVRAAELHDLETGAHLCRISHLVSVLAQHHGFARQQAEMIRTSAALHDIGKLAVARAILNKPGPLNSGEWRLMRQHPVIGAGLLEGTLSPLLHCAREIALSHHEHWDGSGYPFGLSGEEIPVSARIVMLCDQYDALRSVRPYKPAYDHDTACRILFEGDDRTRPEHFDPRLLDLFRRIHWRFDGVWKRWKRRHGPSFTLLAESCTPHPAG